MSKTEKKRKPHIVWIVVLSVVILIAALIIYSGIRGGKQMNDAIDRGLESLSSSYVLSEDTENSYENIRVYGIMDFNIKHYTAEGLGNVCVMKMNMGLMQMFTFVVTPYEKQMPMLSVDYVYTPGKYKAYVELYDLVPDTGTEEYRRIMEKMQNVLNEYSDLSDFETKSAWYDSLQTVCVHKEGNTSQSNRFSSLFEEVMDAYVKASDTLAPLTEKEQAEKLRVIETYVTNSIEKGGLPTRMFKKTLGEDGVRDFFSGVFYGPDCYQR